MQFNVCTFNLYNLVLPEKLYHGTRNYTKNTYNKKIRWIAHQLSTMNTDIVGFQEVWHKTALQEAVRLSGQFKKHQVYMHSRRGSGSVVALASKFPTQLKGPTEAFPKDLSISVSDELTVDEFSRPVLRALVDLNGLEVRVYVAHLKSKRPKFLKGEDEDDLSLKAIATLRSLLIRAAESAALRSVLVSDLSRDNTPAIVLGDLNDGLHAVTTGMITGNHPWRRASLAEKIAAWDCLLYSTYAIQRRRTPRDVYYTHLYNGDYETLDHILISQEFYQQNPNSIGRLVDLRIFNDHLVDETIGGHVESWKSDHAQVVARLEVS